MPQDFTHNRQQFSLSPYKLPLAPGQQRFITMNMKIFIPFLICAISIAAMDATTDDTIPQQNKLFVSIYYSARSTESIHFILTKLQPIYSKIQKYILLDLVPFGKGHSTNVGFYCQNGHIECLANTIHNCVFNQFPENSTAQLEYLNCALQGIDNTIHADEKCAGHVGLSIRRIHTCATTRQGYLLMLAAEIDTKDKTHGPRFVPSYVFDDFYNDRDQRLAREDFEAILCQKLIDHGFTNVCSTIDNVLRVN